MIIVDSGYFFGPPCIFISLEHHNIATRQQAQRH